MTYEVLVKQIEDHFKATVLGLPDCTAEAPTRIEAIQRARAAAVNFIGQGELVQIEVGSRRAASFAGMWAKDDTFEEFEAAIEAHRREIDAETTQP